MTPRTAREITRHPAPSGAGCFRLWAALAGVLLGATALAAEPLRGSVEAGFGIAWSGYDERGPTGRVLDRETGFLPSASLAAELEHSLGFAGLAASARMGDLRYEGRTQSPNAAFDDLPVATTSRARVLGADLRMGAFVDPDRRLAPYAGVGWRSWKREILSTAVVSRTGSTAVVPELDEAYSWLELQLGARCTLARSARTEWRLDARVLRVVGGRVVVSRPGGDVALDLGDRTGGRLALAVRVAVAPRWHVVVEGHGALWSFGASPVDAVALLYEPDSESRTVGIEVRAGATF